VIIIIIIIIIINIIIIIIIIINIIIMGREGEECEMTLLIWRFPGCDRLSL